MGISTHRITVCTSCRHKGRACRPGYELITRLRAAIEAAGDAVSEDFEISGVAHMAGCGRSCTVAYHGTRKAAHLFGDVEPGADVDELVAFAQHYAAEEDGWCSSVDRQCEPRQPTLARVPAAIIAIEDSDVRTS